MNRIPSPLIRLLAYPATSASFLAIAATTTKPATVDSSSPASNVGVFAAAASDLILIPFGAGSDNQTFDIRLIGWRRLTGAESTTPLWIPIHLGDVTATLSASVGVSGGLVTDSERFADTVAVKTNGWSKIEVCAPAADLPAHVMVPSLGFELLSVYFDMTGATSGDVLIGPVVR